MLKRTIEAARVGLIPKLDKFMKNNKELMNLPLDELDVALKNKYSMNQQMPPKKVYRSIRLNSGFVEVDDSYFEIPYDLPADSYFICAVSVKPNSSGVESPVYIFTSKKHPDDLTQEEYEKVESIIIEKNPEFKEIYEKEIYYSEDGQYVDNFGKIRSFEEYKKAPWVGIFLYKSTLN